MIFSCSESGNNKNIGKLYFDFPFVVQKQKAVLEKNNPKIIKKTYINQLMSTDTISIVDWQKEFEVFENLDLNKSSFRDKIVSKPMYRDSGFINYYFRKKDAKISFKRLTSYTTKSNKIKRIWAETEEKTLIYSTKKRIIFKFDTLKNELQSYQFSGSKGFILMPKDSFFVESTILDEN